MTLENVFTLLGIGWCLTTGSELLAWLIGKALIAYVDHLKRKDTKITDEEKQAEYDRWFARGQEAKANRVQLKDTILKNLRPGSNAYEAFADGYTAVAAQTQAA